MTLVPPRVNKGVPFFVALLMVAWFSAGAAPLVDAIGGARAPVDFVRDYVAAHARLHLGRGAAPTDEAGNGYAETLGAPRVVLLEGPYHVHPPPALLLVLPLVPFGFDGAALAWLAISLVSLGALAYALVALADEREPTTLPPVVLAFVLLLLWPPVLHNVAKGQWSIVLTALVALGFRALERRWLRAAGIWFGLAASLKVTPILLLGFLAIRHRRAAWAMITTLASLCLVSLAVGGTAPWSVWLADAPRDVTAWQTWNANTASLNGFLARLLGGGQFARPLVARPALASALNIALALVLLAGMTLLTHRAERTPRNDRRLFAGWAALVVLLNPLAWTHTVVLALIPIALLAREAPLTAAAAFLVLSIPRELLATLAGPLPVGPGRGLVLSLHAAGVGALLAASARLAAHARSPARPDRFPVIGR